MPQENLTKAAQTAALLHDDLRAAYRDAAAAQHGMYTMGDRAIVFILENLLADVKELEKTLNTLTMQ